MKMGSHVNCCSFHLQTHTLQPQLPLQNKKENLTRSVERGVGRKAVISYMTSMFQYYLGGWMLVLIQGSGGEGGD
jgi:hypothetical protein